MYFLFKMGILHCYVCLPEGILFVAPSLGFPDPIWRWKLLFQMGWCVFSHQLGIVFGLQNLMFIVERGVHEIVLQWEFFTQSIALNFYYPPMSRWFPNRNFQTSRGLFSGELLVSGRVSYFVLWLSKVPSLKLLVTLSRTRWAQKTSYDVSTYRGEINPSTHLFSANF